MFVCMHVCILCILWTGSVEMKKGGEVSSSRGLAPGTTQQRQAGSEARARIIGRTVGCGGGVLGWVGWCGMGRARTAARRAALLLRACPGCRE